MLNQLYVLFPTTAPLFEREYVFTKVKLVYGRTQNTLSKCNIYTAVIRFEVHKTDDKKFIDITTYTNVSIPVAQYFGNR